MALTGLSTFFQALGRLQVESESSYPVAPLIFSAVAPSTAPSLRGSEQLNTYLQTMTPNEKAEFEELPIETQEEIALDHFKLVSGMARINYQATSLVGGSIEFIRSCFQLSYDEAEAAKLVEFARSPSCSDPKKISILAHAHAITDGKYSYFSSKKFEKDFSSFSQKNAVILSETNITYTCDPILTNQDFSAKLASFGFKDLDICYENSVYLFKALTYAATVRGLKSITISNCVSIAAGLEQNIHYPSVTEFADIINLIERIPEIESVSFSNVNFSFAQLYQFVRTAKNIPSLQLIKLSSLMSPISSAEAQLLFKLLDGSSLSAVFYDQSNNPMVKLSNRK